MTEGSKALCDVLTVAEQVTNCANNLPVTPESHHATVYRLCYQASLLFVRLAAIQNASRYSFFTDSIEGVGTADYNPHTRPAALSLDGESPAQVAIMTCYSCAKGLEDNIRRIINPLSRTQLQYSVNQILRPDDTWYSLAGSIWNYVKIVAPEIATEVEEELRAEGTETSASPHTLWVRLWRNRFKEEDRIDPAPWQTNLWNIPDSVQLPDEFHEMEQHSTQPEGQNE
ncbi:hypothetical protein TREMEDRAFT_65092 [Tremella mesenterica DSM 1558]|nr:uncharacterized protein TREMEDRAFT_65092 [Tremella mesenterica DSM 1558]EIW66699.1 hypothetical protein TREMEDRAFT_65092 [Tremella mesenterica DSM 1558]